MVIMDLTCLMVAMFVVSPCLSLPAPGLTSTVKPSPDGKKARSLFDQSPYLDGEYNALQYSDDEDDGSYRPIGGLDEDEELLSGRARPVKPDSPVYFIRLPPQPYMYVPGYGYVSQPTRLEPPPFMQRPTSPFLNLPLEYMSNAKPVGVYTLPQQARPKPQRRPQPAIQSQPQHQSNVYNLNKGPYEFNGRPTDVFLLQNAYDNLYSEVLQNIYP
ncbi:uncharacterized protein LOC126841024 [Adelges cooleyi]|uniref:uncharacterized protein LOC126841024 n=1 Tax=Adelges cooleyi TaxID=133065 RepID=UPI00217FB62B|nr:uncharacterized protein LOC126841024 [Adelges cooleyi]